MSPEPDLRKRFLEKTKLDDGTGCLLWTASRHPKGYGRLRHYRALLPAHRVAWLLWKGPIPKGLMVCHKCDTPACVNPDHLFLGTNQDNKIDCAKKKRAHSGWGRQKLAVEDVLAIKAKLKSGGRPAPISREYGVSIFTICKIADGKIWRHVP